MTWVKICGLVRPDDAQLASDLGADALGFVLASSPRRADPQILATWLPQWSTPALKVGVFLDPNEREVWEQVERCGFGAVQLHGTEPPELTERINRQIPVIKRVRSQEEADRYRGHASFLLWEPYPSHATPEREIWAGGLTLEQLPAVLAQQPWGVDVARGVEESPGVKHDALLRRFLQSAK